MLKPTIGIEVHVELKSNAKVYSTGKNDFKSPANTNMTLIDLGYPGTLPKLNQEVIHMALKACHAMHFHINKRMHFDRKNYFYPDLPKGYQITQQDTPIGYDGYLEIEVNGKKKKIEIERIHIEEDTCKSIHGERGTLLNFNRAGVPLIEIVSKPVIESPEEAMLYLEKLRETLLYLGISDVKIEEGSMRCDANISMHEEGEPFGTKCEIKNIGSIRYVGVSLEYEIKRQTEILERGEKIEREQTRRFDENKNTTVLMREKETGNDYRYFPEPDLPFVTISDAWIEEVKNSMPMMPDEIKEKFVELGMNENNIKTLLSNKEICMFLQSILDECNPVIAANLLTGDVLSYMNKEKLSLDELKIDAENFAELVGLLESEKISSKQGKQILSVLLENGGSALEWMKTLGMEQISDTKALTEMIQKVLSENPESVSDFKAGKDRAQKYLMGQIMKASKGQANPKLVTELLTELLNQM